MKKVIALVGTGAAANTHINAYNALEETTVKWVHSCDVDRARQFSKKHNIHNYTTTYNDIINDSETEIVDICNIPSRHLDFAKKALVKNKKVIIEKPIDIDLGKAMEFYRKFKEDDFSILIVYQYPYSETFSKLKEIYMSERYGKLKNYRIKYFSHRDGIYYRKWTSDIGKAGGGVLINQGIHFINLIFGITGYPSMKLLAKAGNAAHHIEVEDTISIQTIHDDGVMGSFLFSTALPSALCIELFFEKAFVSTKGGEINLQNDGQLVLSTPKKGDFKMLVEDFFHKLNNYSCCKMNFKASIEDLRIVRSAYISAQENRTVEFKRMQ